MRNSVANKAGPTGCPRRQKPDVSSAGRGCIGGSEVQGVRECCDVGCHRMC